MNIVWRDEMKRLLFAVCVTLCLLKSIPVFAQGSVRVKCDRFTMNVPSENMKCYQVDGNIPVSEEASPEEIANAQVANTAIAFPVSDFPTSEIEPQVIFYATDDFAKTSFDLVDLSMDLSDIISNVKSGYSALENIYTRVPFIPYQAEERQAAALPQKIDFENGSGIRTLAVFQDSISSSASRSNLYYSYQGITDDGNYYISAVIPLRCSRLDNQPVSGIDWNSVSGTDFYPSLEELDYYVSSIVIE